MSSAFALHERADAGRADSRPAAARIVRPVLLCLTLACAFVLLARYAVLPLVTIRHVIVQSDVSLSEDELLSISGLQGITYWHSIAADVVRKRLEAYPLVRRARVEKLFPDTVRLTVWGRQPVALVLADVGGRTLPVLVDDEGVVFKICSSSVDLDLPVVSGISAGEASLGQQLPGAYAPLFAQLRDLREKSPSLVGLLSEVRVVGRGPQAPAGNYDLLIYLTSSPVPVLAGSTIDESLLRYSLMVLDLLSKQGVLKNIQELDFRGGQVVYRMKGG